MNGVPHAGGHPGISRVREHERKLRIGQAIIIVIGVAFMILTVVLTAFLNPLPDGEADFVGMTFEQIQATNPRLADNMWHTNMGFGSILFGVSLAVVFLAWRGLSTGSRLAWYSILIVTLSFLAGVLAAHIPVYVRYPNYTHWVLPFTFTVVQLVALALTAKPVFSMEHDA